MKNGEDSSQIEIQWAPKQFGKFLVIIVTCLTVLYLLERKWSVELVAGLAFCVLVFPALIIKSRDKRPCIIINDEGFFDRRLHTGIIPWSDIKAFKVVNVHGTKCIGLVFYDEHKYRYHVSWFIRFCAFITRMPSMSTTASGTEICFDDLYRFMSERHSRCAIG
jgi:hypothetical protein